MSIRVPVLGAEKLTAPAPESGQADFPPATGASIYHALRRSWLVRSGTIRRRFAAVLGSRTMVIIRSRARAGCGGRNRTLLAGELQIHGRCRWRRGRRRRRCGGGGVKALLAHVVGGGVSDDAAVVDAESYGFGDLELGLFLLRSLSHLLIPIPVFREKKKKKRKFFRERNLEMLERETVEGWIWVWVWRMREKGREKWGFEGGERSVMAMEYGPHRDAYQTFFCFLIYLNTLQTFLYLHYFLKQIWLLLFLEWL